MTGSGSPTPDTTAFPASSTPFDLIDGLRMVDFEVFSRRMRAAFPNDAELVAIVLATVEALLTSSLATVDAGVSAGKVVLRVRRSSSQ